MKVYLVTDGEYSDYRVLGVYSTKEKANEAKTQFATENDLEEFELDNELPTYPPGMVRWEVELDKDGNASVGAYRENPRRASSAYALEDSSDYYPTFDYEGNDYIKGRKITKFVVFRVWATDPEHALKIANERRAQLVATNEWTEDFDTWRKLLRKREEAQ